MNTDKESGSASVSICVHLWLEKPPAQATGVAMLGRLEIGDTAGLETGLETCVTFERADFGNGGNGPTEH